MNLRLPPIRIWRSGEPWPVDFISAGAITQAALFSLSRIPGLCLHARVLDDDIAEVSNLNRYLLLRASDLGIAKVAILENSVRDTSIEVEGICRRATPETLEALGDLFGAVAVGVDDIPSRWLVQARQPSWLGVGATTGLMVLVSEHFSHHPCVGCLHPHDEGSDEAIPTVSFVSALAGILLAYRLMRQRTEPTADATLGYPLTLASPVGVSTIAVAANRDCPVACPQALRLAA